MDYIDALNYIEDENKYGSNMGVHIIRELLNQLGSPDKDMDCIHIAGTNGKGSTASYIAGSLEEAGYKVGLFSSPYLERINERFQINGENISDEDLAKITSKVKKASEDMIERGLASPTHFEIITAIMFLYFNEEDVDYIVLEVGLGGRLDSTNVIQDSLISIITTIDYDHVEILGESLREIAVEKAGIIKKDGLVVSYPQAEEVRDVLLEVARSKGADLYFNDPDKVKVLEETSRGSLFNLEFENHKIEKIKISMIGHHQIYNASLAISALLLLRDRGLVEISDKDLFSGIEKTSWKGRLELLGERPRFLIDGAHNEQGAKQLVRAIELFDYEKLYLVLALLTDKDVDQIVASLSSLADEIIVTEVDYDLRKLDSSSLAEKVAAYNKNISITKDSSQALEEILKKAGSNDLVVVAGSLYLIGELRGKINLL